MAATVGVKFAGVDLLPVLGSSGAVYVSNITGRSLLPLEVTAVSSTAYDGDRFVSAKLPSRDIDVQFSALGDGTEATARINDLAIQGALLSREPARLEFTDQPGRWYEGILASAVPSQGGKTWLTANATFNCSRPFLYAAAVEEAVVAGIHTAQTNWYVEPVWKITLGTGVSGFTLTVNGVVYEYTGALASSAVVTVDTAARETRIGGQLRVLEVSGAYPVLGAENVVTLSVAGTVSVEYQPRWA